MWREMMSLSRKSVSRSTYSMPIAFISSDWYSSYLTAARCVCVRERERERVSERERVIEGEGDERG